MASLPSCHTVVRHRDAHYTAQISPSAAALAVVPVGYDCYFGDHPGAAGGSGAIRRADAAVLWDKLHGARPYGDGDPADVHAQSHARADRRAASERGAWLWRGQAQTAELLRLYRR